MPRRTATRNACANTVGKVRQFSAERDGGIRANMIVAQGQRPLYRIAF